MGRSSIRCRIWGGRAPPPPPVAWMVPARAGTEDAGARSRSATIGPFSTSSSSTRALPLRQGAPPAPPCLQAAEEPRRPREPVQPRASPNLLAPLLPQAGYALPRGGRGGRPPAILLAEERASSLMEGAEELSGPLYIAAAADFFVEMATTPSGPAVPPAPTSRGRRRGVSPPPRRSPAEEGARFPSPRRASRP
jgi:hypothetical protein